MAPNFAVGMCRPTLRSDKCGLTFADTYAATAQMIVGISASNFSKFQRNNVDRDSHASAIKDVR